MGSASRQSSAVGSGDALKKKTAADWFQNHTTAITGHSSVYTHEKTYREQFYLVRPEGESPWPMVLPTITKGIGLVRQKLVE